MSAPQKQIAIVVAMAKNRVIGKDGGLPWKLSADLRRFKALTMGHTLVMGRKTYESIGRPLPGRTTIIVTRQRDFAAPSGVLIAHSFDEAVAKAPTPLVCVVGGAEIYALALPRADILHLTVIDREIAGDTTFPALDLTPLQKVREEPHPADETNEFDYTFFEYRRPPRYP